MTNTLDDTTWICVDKDDDNCGKVITVLDGESDPSHNGENTITFIWEADGTVDESKFRRFITRFEQISPQTIQQQYQRLNTALKSAQDIVFDLKFQIQTLQEACTHPNMVDNWGTGVCPDCHYRTVGWYCKDSPTKECEYYNPESDTYNDDSCIYCGNPEEQK